MRVVICIKIIERVWFLLMSQLIYLTHNAKGFLWIVQIALQDLLLGAAEGVN